METVYCELKYSGAGIAFLLGAAAATFGVVLATPLDPAFRALSLAWTATSACAGLEGLLAASRLRVDETGAVQVELRDGRALAGTLRRGSFVAPWLTVLRWRPEGARFDRTLLLLPDMAAAESLRKIRVILRWA